MNRFSLLFVLGATLTTFACSSTTPDDAVGSDDALTGSLADAKACAVRDAYAAAQLSAFQSAAKTELPGVDPSISTQLSKFDVKDVGRVFVVEQSGTMSFYDGNGAFLVKATLSSTGKYAWTKSNGAAFGCGGDDDDDDGLDDDDDDVRTCLSTASIDATQYPYTRARAAVTGACTQAELTTISNYYRDNVAVGIPLDSWEASVSPDCAACAFGDPGDATWAPILVDDNGKLDINRGGCLEVVSGSEACGRAYQQYQDCTIDACLQNCTTQEEFTKCRQDPAVHTTACKDAVQNVKSACGETNLTLYESMCKGTTYTFEGPINVMCVSH